MKQVGLLLTVSLPILPAGGEENSTIAMDSRPFSLRHPSAIYFHFRIYHKKTQSPGPLLVCWTVR